MLLFEVLFGLQIKPKTVMFYKLSASVIQVEPLSHERRMDEIEFAAWTACSKSGVPSATMHAKLPNLGKSSAPMQAARGVY